jgi:hypothetical protein
LIALLASGRVIDAVLACLLLELLVLLAWRLVRREHAVHADVYFNMVAAVGLLAAAHAVLSQAGWGLTGAALLVALAAHGVALRLRWRAGHRPMRPVNNGLPSGRPIRR